MAKLLSSKGADYRQLYIFYPCVLILTWKSKVASKETKPPTEIEIWLGYLYPSMKSFLDKLMLLVKVRIFIVAEYNPECEVVKKSNHRKKANIYWL
jgi:hypothetical protein